MMDTQRRKLSMVTKVIEFSLAHPSPDAGYTALVTRLQETLEQLRAVAKQQRDSTVEERAARNTRREARRRIARQLLHLKSVARLAARTHPELPAKFVLPPSRGANRIYLIGAEVLLDQAKEYQEILGPLSLGETFIADLEANIATYERLTAEAHGGRLGHVEARSGIQEVLAECLEIVAVLDGFNEARLADNVAALDTWKSARNVFGPFRTPEIDSDDDADEDDEVLIDNEGPSEAAA